MLDDIRILLPVCQQINHFFELAHPDEAFVQLAVSIIIL